MTSMTAIKAFFGNEDPAPSKPRSYPITPITNKELIDLKKLPKAEYEAFAQGACAAMGVDWEPTV